MKKTAKTPIRKAFNPFTYVTSLRLIFLTRVLNQLKYGKTKDQLLAIAMITAITKMAIPAMIRTFVKTGVLSFMSTPFR